MTSIEFDLGNGAKIALPSDIVVRNLLDSLRQQSPVAHDHIQVRMCPADIGGKWPGTEAIYAGRSLSRDGSRLVDLIFWPDESKKERSYTENIEYCASVSPQTNSHAATRQQAIVINDNLRHLLSTSHGYWTETKDNTGKYAFVQFFDCGVQDNNNLISNCRALAVSEIH